MTVVGTRTALGIIAGLLTVMSSSGASQVVLTPTWQNAVQVAKSRLEKGGPPLAVILEAHRVPLLTQQAFRLQRRLGREKTPSLVSIEFFHVVPVSLEVVNGEIRAESAGDFPTLSTAYRATNDRWYYVSGFGNELAEVNSLISDLGLELRTERDALDVAEYVLDLVGGGTEFQSSIVSDELSLQAAVSLDIVRRYGPAERTRRFDRWWATNTATRKAVHAPTAKRSATAFNVTFFRYVMEQVRQEQVTLDFRGNASGLSLQ